jgi:hypothetical protein
MLHTIVKYLQGDYRCTVVCKNAATEYEFDGVKVIPRCTSLIRSADLVICQLDVVKEALILRGNKPLIWIMHNTFHYPTVQENVQIGVVYNSQTAKEMKQWANDGFVLTPPIDYDYYNGSTGDCITLINCNENKGGKIFHEIAKRMPHLKFLQVLGSYGTQYISTDDKQPVINMDNYAIRYGLGALPNVEVIDNTTDIRSVYKRTKVLLMPSEYESWGMVATEAMCSGIPVIAAPTFGLKENLNESGIFVERNDINAWCMEIEKLQAKKEYTEASDKARKRAKELSNPSKLKEFAEWVKKFVDKHKPI